MAQQFKALRMDGILSTEIRSPASQKQNMTVRDNANLEALGPDAPTEPFGLPGQSTALQTSHSHPRAQSHAAASQPPEQPKADGDSPFQEPPTSFPLAGADRTTHMTRFGVESQGAAASASASALGPATTGTLPGSGASEGDVPALPGLIGAGVVGGAQGEQGQGGAVRAGSSSRKRGSKALWLAAAAKTGAVSEGGRLKMRALSTASTAGSLAALLRKPSVLQRELATKARGVALLSPETREWLNVDKYGKPLQPTGAGGDAEGAGGGGDRAGPSWRSVLSHYREALWRLMTEPDSSRAAHAASLLVMSAILISTAAFCLETLPEFSKERSPAAYDTFAIIEMVTVQIFALDYLLRLVSCPSLLPFLVSPLNVIDLVSIVPWYVEAAMEDSGMQGTAVFRVLRLLRVFRVLKLGARYRKLLVVTSAFAKSLDMLALMAFFVSLVVVAAATLLYFAERGSYDPALGYYVRDKEKYTRADGSPIVSPFESIVTGLWWAIVTVMTVGYGDIVPISVGGRVVACATMLAGLLAIALPIAVIGTNFSSEWEAAKQREAAGAEGTDQACPNVSLLSELVDTHLLTMRDLGDILDEATSSVSDAVSALRDAGQLSAREVDTAAAQRGRAGLLQQQHRAAAQAAASCLASLGVELQPGPTATGIAIATAAGPVGQLGHNDQAGDGRAGSRGGSGRPVAEAWEEPGAGAGAGAGAGRAVGAGPGPGAGESAQVLRYSDSAHESVEPGEGVAFGHRGPAERQSPGVGGGDHQMQGVMSRELETQAVAAGAGAWGGAGEQSAHGGSGGVAGAGSGARLEGWRPVATPPAARGATVAKLQDALVQLYDDDAGDLYDKVVSEVREVLSSQLELAAHWRHLEAVLRAVQLLSSGRLGELAGLMRGQCRQLVQLRKEAEELCSRVDLLDQGLAQLEEEAAGAPAAATSGSEHHQAPFSHRGPGPKRGLSSAKHAALAAASRSSSGIPSSRHTPDAAAAATAGGTSTDPTVTVHEPGGGSRGSTPPADQQASSPGLGDGQKPLPESQQEGDEPAIDTWALPHGPPPQPLPVPGPLTMPRAVTATGTMGMGSMSMARGMSMGAPLVTRTPSQLAGRVEEDAGQGEGEEEEQEAVSRAEHLELGARAPMTGVEAVGDGGPREGGVGAGDVVRQVPEGEDGSTPAGH